MERFIAKFLKGSRFLFISIFILMTIGMVTLEIYGLILIGNKKPEVTMASKTEIRNENLVIGEAADTQESGTTDIIVAADARPEIIRRYLEKYHSPLLPYSQLIFDLSQTYGFDYRWIVAIGQQESNLCKKIPENSYNCWGYGIHSKGTLRFESYDQSLRSYAEYLDREYFKKGLDTPEEIMKK